METRHVTTETEARRLADSMGWKLHRQGAAYVVTNELESLLGPDVGAVIWPEYGFEAKATLADALWFLAENQFTLSAAVSEEDAADAYQQGKTEAAQELFARLVARGISDENWNGGDVVEVVDTWLQEHGIDTAEPYDKSEGAGCTCCQVSTESTRADEDECPSCGHLMQSHEREDDECGRCGRRVPPPDSGPLGLLAGSTWCACGKP